MKTTPFLLAEKMKYLKVNLIKEMKFLHINSYKTAENKIKTNKQKII